MKRIVFIDFDGTLLADDRSLPEVNRRCIEKLLSDGHIVAFNTGRSIKSGMGLINGFGFSDPDIYLLSYSTTTCRHHRTAHWQEHSYLSEAMPTSG